MSVIQNFTDSICDNPKAVVNYTKIFKSQKNFINKLNNCKISFDVLQNIVVNNLVDDNSEAFIESKYITSNNNSNNSLLTQSVRGNEKYTTSK